MRCEHVIRDGSWASKAEVNSSVSRAPFLRAPAWGRMLVVVAVALMLLAACGDGGTAGHVHEDDFIVSFPSPLEIVIRRPFDQPFDLVEVGVTPFVNSILGPEPYILVVSGIAFVDGTEIIFEAPDIVRQAFIDPLEEQVIEVLIACDCFVDYVILHSPLGETTLLFD